jgi:hypothetical protein
MLNLQLGGERDSVTMDRLLTPSRSWLYTSATHLDRLRVSCDGGAKRLHFHGVSEEGKGVITGGLLVVSDHRIDTGSKSFHGEGLDHYLHAEFELDTPERGVLGIAGNKQHFQPG